LEVRFLKVKDWSSPITYPVLRDINKKCAKNGRRKVPPLISET
jgi:hypothetical protein